MKGPIIMPEQQEWTRTDPVNKDICHPNHIPLSSFIKATTSVSSYTAHKKYPPIAYFLLDKNLNF